MIRLPTVLHCAVVAKMANEGTPHFDAKAFNGGLNDILLQEIFFHMRIL
jgi:hypothetical protein